MALIVFAKVSFQLFCTRQITDHVLKIIIIIAYSTIGADNIDTIQTLLSLFLYALSSGINSST